MTDEDLLRDAAQAAGIKWDRRDECWYGNPPVRPDWNPLTDDGDALRMAVLLCIRIFPPEPHLGSRHDRASTNVFVHDGCEGDPAYRRALISAAEGWEGARNRGDPWAATRRAIVRAAAVLAQEPSA